MAVPALIEPTALLRATRRGRGQGSPKVQARARACWVLATDLANEAVAGTTLSRVLDLRGKVGRGGDDRTSRARKLACYLAVTIGDVTSRQLGMAAGLDSKTVWVHVREVEDWRDDGTLDAAIEDMGRELVRRACLVVLGNLGDAA